MSRETIVDFFWAGFQIRLSEPLFVGWSGVGETHILGGIDHA